jgi:hypothetical protein
MTPQVAVSRDAGREGPGRSTSRRRIRHEGCKRPRLEAADPRRYLKLREELKDEGVLPLLVEGLKAAQGSSCLQWIEALNSL